MISLLIHTQFARGVMLSLDTVSVEGTLLLDIVSFVLPSSGELLWRLRCPWFRSSIAITLLSAEGIVTFSSVFSESRAIADTKGCVLRKF